jgi:hypothetical protein
MSSRDLASRAPAMIAGALALILTATTAGAAVLPAPVGESSISGLQSAAGNACAPGERLGLNGVCHPESWFIRRAPCPPGTHLGTYGRRCWPN